MVTVIFVKKVPLYQNFSKCELLNCHSGRFVVVELVPYQLEFQIVTRVKIVLSLNLYSRTMVNPYITVVDVYDSWCQLVRRRLIPKNLNGCVCLCSDKIRICNSQMTRIYHVYHWRKRICWVTMVNWNKCIWSRSHLIIKSSQDARCQNDRWIISLFFVQIFVAQNKWLGVLFIFEISWVLTTQSKIRVFLNKRVVQASHLPVKPFAICK